MMQSIAWPPARGNALRVSILELDPVTFVTEAGVGWCYVTITSTPTRQLERKVFTNVVMCIVIIASLTNSGSRHHSLKER